MSSPTPKSADLDLKVGDVDTSGNVIKAVYAKQPGKYAIYETNDHRVVIKTDASLADHPNINELLSSIADLTTHIPSLKPKYNSRLAHSMKVYLDGDFEASGNLLKQIYRDMNFYLERQSRIAYLSGAAILMVIVLCVFLISRALGVSGQVSLHILWALVFSSMGGFLSIALGSQKLKIDLQNSYLANVVYGALRVVVAMICGVLVYFLIRGDFLLGFIKRDLILMDLSLPPSYQGSAKSLFPTSLTVWNARLTPILHRSR